MQSFKFTDMWEIIDRFSLQLDCEIPQSCLCVLCHKVLRNAKQLLCGCRCCLRCLEMKIVSGEAFCPGDSEECQQQSFTTEMVFQDDNHANKEISKLIIKCISEGCDVTDSLKNICQHILVCPLYSSECPQCNITIKRIDMDEHLREVCTESQLQCEYCGKTVTRNVMETVHRKADNPNVCDNLECVCPYDCDIEGLVLIKTHLRVCTNRPLRCPYSDIGCNSDLIPQRQMEAHLSRDGYDHAASLLQTISNMENEVHRVGDAMVPNCEERLRRLEEEMARLRAENSELRQMLCPSGVSSDTVDSLARRVIRCEQRFEQKYLEYVWVVSNFKALTFQAKADPGKHLLSDVFFTSRNGYRLQMVLFANGHGVEWNRSVSLYFQILKGKFDDILDWPFKCNVEMSLLDQGGDRHHRLNLFFDPSDDAMMEHYQKPQDNDLRLFGFPNFIAKNQMSRVPGWKRNNTLFIRFYAEPVDL